METKVFKSGNSLAIRLPKTLTSATVSLAALETLVHLNPQMRFKYVVFSIEFDEGLVEKVTASSLPADWQVEPPPLSTKYLGDQWVRDGKSPALPTRLRIIILKNYLKISANLPWAICRGLSPQSSGSAKLQFREALVVFISRYLPKLLTNLIALLPDKRYLRVLM